MSLDWSVSAIKDHAVVTTHPDDEKRWHPVTEGLVWLSLICGFTRIEEKNLELVKTRVAQYQAAFGPYLNTMYGEGIYILDSDIVAHVGLSTNASRRSDDDWAHHMLYLLAEEGTRINGNKRNLPGLELVALLSITGDDGKRYVRTTD